jgi:hypothetical protein
MHPNARQAFIERIIAIARKASLTGNLPLNFPSTSVETTLISIWTAQQPMNYNSCITSCLTPIHVEICFQKYIKENIEDILVNAVASDDPQKTSEQVDELLAEIEIYNKEFLVIVPLVGLGSITESCLLGKSSSDDFLALIIENLQEDREDNFS